jgi:hypothetical protein
VEAVEGGLLVRLLQEVERDQALLEALGVMTEKAGALTGDLELLTRPSKARDGALKALVATRGPGNGTHRLGLSPCGTGGR